MKVAIIFAAGAGRRLNPLTKTIHKSLVNVDGLPLIEYLIKNLLTLKTLKEIVIITGYKTEDFWYLKDKYPKISFVDNPSYMEYESAYALSLLPKDIFDHDLFFISGDFVMKENCFNDNISDNVMAALKRENNKEDWSYKLNQEGDIIGLEKNTDINSLLASEWSHITQKWSQKIAASFNNESELTALKTTMIGQYLINRSMKDNMPLKPYLLPYNSFWDLDNEYDLERIKKYFNS